MKGKKIQIKMIKKQSEEENLFNSIDYESLSLFREMMADRFKTIDNEQILLMCLISKGLNLLASLSKMLR